VNFPVNNWLGRMFKVKEKEKEKESVKHSVPLTS
jgi:hypothetical protein